MARDSSFITTSTPHEKMLKEEIVPFLTLFCSIVVLASIRKLSFAADTLTPNQTIGDTGNLASSGGIFELGFFSRGASNNRYLGIWYTNSPDTIVWVANRNNPITDFGGAVTISETGNLVVLNQSKGVIWSSNVSEILADPVVQLLDTGNLVLKDKSKSSTKGSTAGYIWQSFEQPTDTILPGMKVGWNLKTGRETYLRSWTSADNPSCGEFSYRLEIQGLPQLVLASGTSKKYRTGAWNGFFFSGIPLLKSAVLRTTVVRNKDEVYYTYEPINSSIIARLTLNLSGVVQRYAMFTSTHRWSGIYWAPFDLCDNYGQCGANSICSSGTCLCPKGFIITGQQGLFLTNWTSSNKCERRLTLNCQSGEGFVRIERVKLPDMIDFWWNETLDPQECKVECLRKCSCMAYANLNMSGGGRGCMMWFGDLIDIKETSSTQELYIRVSASESELLNDSSKKNNIRTILAASLSSVFGIIILGMVICVIRRQTQNKASKQCVEDNVEVPLFDFGVVAAATNSFSEENIVGAGGFGTVYKGELSTGQMIAVKRLSKSSGQGVEEFRNEVTLIAKLQHRNLVGLIGSCMHGEERMLIYEYMPNGSLDYFLFDHRSTTILRWKERFNIVLGIARGLLYLHEDSKLLVVHRDLKASNILLDSDLNPRISDFGLARIFDADNKQARTKRVIGTYGYMSPEYAIDGRFSMKSDVFSFGVLLLEIVSSKRNRGFSHFAHYHNLLGHAWLLWQEERAMELMDAALKDSYEASQVLRCIQVGLLCVQKHPQDRPAMSSVVFMLANEGAVLPQPKQPGFFIERGSSPDATLGNEEFSTGNALTFTMPDSR